MTLQEKARVIYVALMLLVLACILTGGAWALEIGSLAFGAAIAAGSIANPNVDFGRL